MDNDLINESPLLIFLACQLVSGSLMGGRVVSDYSQVTVSWSRLTQCKDNRSTVDILISSDGT